MDLKVIADNIAARFVDVSATVGTTTETVTATADLPDSIARGPVLLVFPPTGSLVIEPSATLRDEYDFFVKLLRDPPSKPIRTRWLYAWATALRGRVELDMDIGLPTIVESAEAVAMRVEIEGEPYGDAEDPFDVVELTIHVQINEVGFPIGA